MKPVPEREAAKAAGERFYVTGKPCRNGHLSKRYTRDGICAACAVAKQLKWQATAIEHPARAAARAAGQVHYASGKPCKHGHEDRHFVANGLCVTCSDLRCRKWKAARPGYEAAAARRRRAADPTSHREASKKWAESNVERKRASDKAWGEANADHRRAYQNAYVQNRRARKAKNGGSYTPEDVAELHRKQNSACAACGADKRKLELDHIVPVVRGGSNFPSNLQLLCSTCNKSKGSKDFEDWMEIKGYTTRASVFNN